MASSKLVIGILMAAGIALIIAVPAMLILGLQPSMQASGGNENLQPTVNITIYAKELQNGKFGWGFSSDNITSPGPILTFKVGDVVNATVFNVGKLPHAWRITDSNATNANVLFNAEVASGSSPLTPGASGSTIFTVNKAGNYYYICPVPGHVQLGMWGKIIVQP